ncbi:MAG: 16S rRNA (guanine(527)-N(7))-methyltransferase RsmG [Anaerolineae bacterium]
MDLLKAGAQDLHIPLKIEHLEAYQRYYDILVEWNEKFNLTAITDYDAAQVRHFLDSLSCLLALEPTERLAGRRVIDVGTGAGFPGIPLKIYQPAMQLTLLEATAKKTDFLQHLVAQLGLEGVTVLHGRAEDLGQDLRHRERYDWAIARAVAEMAILAEYLLPLTRIGGRVLAQKGESAAAEVQRAEWSINRLGGHVRRLIPVELRGLAETRHLVVLDKVAATPGKYPRRPGMPSKRPLMPED